jgi:hypothetical protein
MNPGLWTDMLLPDYLMPLKNYYKCRLRTHKKIPKINTVFGLHFDQVLSVHSLRMHKDHSAVHYPSHRALRTWWFCLLCIHWNCVLSLMMNRQVTLYIYTVFTQPHNNTILYRCANWKLSVLAVSPAKMAVRCEVLSKSEDVLPG